MSSFVRGAMMCVCLLTSGASLLSAQTGSITGRVTEKTSGAPIARAQVDAAGGSSVTSATSGEDGSYTISNLSPGTYTLSARKVGRAPNRTENVVVRAGAPTTADFAMITATELDQVVITASRQAEKIVDAPASVSAVPPDVVAARPALTSTDHIKGLAGVDISNGGLLQANVVARGFNNIFSGALMTLTDNRFAAVPSLAVNVPYLVPITNEDIERIEVVLGPGAALYGPNTANGVMNIITKSPFESQGTSITLGGGVAASSGSGDVNIYRTALRHASKVNDKFAFKLSGEYTGGSDWRFFDPAEPSTAKRDFALRRYAGEARVDVRPTPGSEWITSYGRVTAGSAIELTGYGAGQVKDWTYQSVQSRLHVGRLFAQAFGNFSDAGETVLLRTNSPIIDQSRLYAAQVQHGMTFGRIDAIYGADYQRIDPRTAGTINGRNENDDLVTEIGGYLHTVTKLSDQFQFLAAARLDHHNRVEENAFSPRVALVFKPQVDQTLRVTFNRAFSNPSNFNLFLDLPSGSQSFGALGSYRFVGLGVPKEGFHFRRDCSGGLCMRSPFAAIPGTAANPAQFIEADATLRWRTAVELAIAQNPAAAFLRSLPAPTKATVASVLKVLDITTRTFSPVNAADVHDIEGLKPSIANAFETGYKGVIGGRMQLSVDLWHEKRRNFVGPSLVETPNVFLDSATTARYLSGFPLPAAAAQAVPVLAGGMAKIPLGTIAPDHPLTNTPGPDIIITYRNYGKLDVTGADFAGELLLDAGYSVAGNYSWVDKDLFSKTQVGGISDVTLNAPANKAMLALRYNNNTPQPYGWELRGRYVAGFPVASGVYNGTVATYTLLDANVAIRLPRSNDVTLSISGQNLLDKKHQEFVGVPALGRFFMTQLRYTF